ncbi:MAG: 50S ribosomal protein L10 [Parcubacteria group bacterium]|nr:50S ribosomal protein L10 [Parcubacteria group bacterium]
MLTREEKTKSIEESKAAVKKSRNLLFADFGGVSVEELRKLRRAFSEKGASFKVVKKKLLRIALKESGVDFDPERFDAQAGTIFSPLELNEAASPLAKFAKENKNFKILGAYDLEKGEFLAAETVRAIGSLPAREVLLAQFVGTVAGPIRAFLYVLSEKAKKAA